MYSMPCDQYNLQNDQETMWKQTRYAICKLLYVKVRYPIYTTLCWRLNLLSMRPESWEKDFLWLQNIEFAPIWPQLIHLCKSKLDWVRRLAQRLKEHTYHSFSHTIYCHERMISACFIGSYETGKLGQVAGAGNQDVLLMRRPTNQEVLMFVTLQYWFWVCCCKYHMIYLKLLLTNQAHSKPM